MSALGQFAYIIFFSVGCLFGVLLEISAILSSTRCSGGFVRENLKIKKMTEWTELSCMNMVLIVAFAIMDACGFEEGDDFDSKQYSKFQKVVLMKLSR